MKVTPLGLDLAKSIFQLHGVDERGSIAVQKRVTRSKLRETVAQLGSVKIRPKTSLGHDPKCSRGCSRPYILCQAKNLGRVLTDPRREPCGFLRVRGTRSLRGACKRKRNVFPPLSPRA